MYLEATKKELHYCQHSTCFSPWLVRHSEPYCANVVVIEQTPKQIRVNGKVYRLIVIPPYPPETERKLQVQASAALGAFEFCRQGMHTK